MNQSSPISYESSHKSCADFVTEPLLGTAMETQRWLLWEYPGPWPAKIDSITHEMIEYARQCAQELDAYLLLIRRHEKKYQELSLSPKIFYSDGQIITRHTYDPYARIRASEIAQTSYYPHPLFLICTNGKRDKCCAIYGRTLIEHLAIQEHIHDHMWECTHFGGHRFAPMMLCLPSGYSYGRLTVSTAESIIAASLADKVVAQNLRGKSAYTCAQQIADGYIRQQYAPLSPQAVTVKSRTPLYVEVTVTENNQIHHYAVELAEYTIPLRPTSCGAPYTSGQTFIVRDSYSILCE